MWLHRRAAHLLLLLSVLGLPLLARGQSSRATSAAPRQPCAAPQPVTYQGGPITHPLMLADVGGTLFFVRLEGTKQTLWKSDGTVMGTGAVGGSPWQDIALLGHLTAVGNRLFFTVKTTVGMELWTSDGTTNSPLHSFAPDGLGDQSYFTAVGSKLFFAAADVGMDFELWWSDGFPSGTRRVMDIRAGSSEGSYPSELTEMNGQLYFAADDGNSGTELWRSDGTQTVMVKDIRSLDAPSQPSFLRVMGGMLYFTATGDGRFNATLWRSDGTAAGTQEVASQAFIQAQGGPQDLTVAGSRLFFRLKDAPTGEEVWVSDGTEAGTHIVANIQKDDFDSTPRQLTAVGDQVFFLANDAHTGQEPWRSDGTPEGTMLVRDFIPGSSGPVNPELASGPGVLLAQIDDGVFGSELWKVDAEGAVRLTDIAPQAASSTPRMMTMSGGRLYFVAYDPSQSADVLFFLPLNQVDCSAPVLWCPSTQLVEAVNPQGAFFSVPPPLVLDDSVAAPQVSSTRELRDFFTKGDHPITVTATDAVGNSNSCDLLVRVQDTTPPLLLCPPWVEQEATGPSGALATYFVVASDAAAADLKVSYSQAPGSVFPVGPTTVDVFATDGTNSNECHFQLTIHDTVKPLLSCPEDQVFQATSAEPVPVNYPYTVYDAVTPSPEFITEHPPGSLFPVGDTHVTLAVKDLAGNVSDACSFWVKNVDPEPPTITCPEPLQVATSSSEGSVVRFTASAADNLGEVHVSYSQEPGSLFPLGETLVTATATDVGQKTASCTFTVTVVEKTVVDGGCQAGASGGVLGWLLLVLAPVWARRRAEQGVR